MILPDENVPNFTIFSGEKPFHVDKFRLSLRLARFKNDPSLLLGSSYKIQSDCSENGVKSFLDIANSGKCPELTYDNVIDFQKLSSEFDFNSLQIACDNFLISQKNLTKHVQGLITANKIPELHALENAISRNLDKMLNSIREFPVLVLYRIFSNHNRRISSEKQLVNFIKSKIDKGEKEAKLLLSTINSNMLSLSDLSTVIKLSDESFHATNIGESLISQIMKLSLENDELRKELNSVKESISHLSNKTHQNSMHIQNSNQTHQNSHQAHQNTNQNANQNHQNTTKAQNRNENKLKTEKNSSQKPQNLNQNTNQSQNHSQTGSGVMTMAEKEAAAKESGDNFQSVYVPAGGDIKMLEKKVLDLINSRRNKNKLRNNEDLSNDMRGYYASLETVPTINETAYTILQDRFAYEVNDYHPCIFSSKDSDLENVAREEINKIPQEKIFKANHLGISVVKYLETTLCAFFLGNFKYGEDQEDVIPENFKVQPSSSSTSTSASASNVAGSNDQSKANIHINEKSADFEAKLIKAFYYHKNRKESPQQVKEQSIVLDEKISQQLRLYLINNMNVPRLEYNIIKTEFPVLKNCRFRLSQKSQPKSMKYDTSKQNENHDCVLVAVAAIHYKDDQGNDWFSYLIAYEKAKQYYAQIKIFNYLKTFAKLTFDLSLSSKLEKFVRPDFDSNSPEGLSEISKEIGIQSSLFSIIPLNDIQLDSIEDDKSMKKGRTKIKLASTVGIAAKMSGEKSANALVIAVK